MKKKHTFCKQDQKIQVFPEMVGQFDGDLPMVQSVKPEKNKSKAHVVHARWFLSHDHTLIISKKFPGLQDCQV